MTSVNKEEKLLFSPGWCLPRIPASIWLPVAVLLPVRWRRLMRCPGWRVESPSRPSGCWSSRYLTSCARGIGLFPSPVVSVCSSYSLLHDCFAPMKSLRWFTGRWKPSSVPTSFLPCSHARMIFRCDFIVLNDLFLSPPNIWQRLTVFVIIVSSSQNVFFVSTTFVLAGFPQHIMCFVCTWSAAQMVHDWHRG